MAAGSALCGTSFHYPGYRFLSPYGTCTVGMQVGIDMKELDDVKSAAKDLWEKLVILIRVFLKSASSK